MELFGEDWVEGDCDQRRSGGHLYDFEYWRLREGPGLLLYDIGCDLQE